MEIPKIRHVSGGEQAQYLLRDYKENTMRFVRNSPDLVEPDVLHKAAKTVIESVDVLPVIFLSDGTGGYWYILEGVGETNDFHYAVRQSAPRNRGLQTVTEKQNKESNTIKAGHTLRFGLLFVIGRI